MQLKIQRSQRAAALSGKVIFCLDARILLTAEEQSNVNKYRLGSEIIYNSEASRKQLDAAAQAHAQGSYLKTLGRIALVAMNLNITINSLQKGQHIECKDMSELLAAEEALNNACENLKSFLETAATFDGREVVIDYSTAEPKLVASAMPAAIPAPPTAAVPPAATFSLPQETPAPAAASVAILETQFAQSSSPVEMGELIARWKGVRPLYRFLAAGSVTIILPTLFFGGIGLMIGLIVFVGYGMLELTMTGMQ